ncbi:MAG: DUF1667 domain-containing protein [Elusimicrobiota bacterium]|nr:DUF1667 domain-containing protein [Elusimicrobiota bacterium]
MDAKNGYAVSGNSCERGEAYGKKELTNPTRVITSTAIVKDGVYLRVPVKTDKDIAKGKIFEAMLLLDNLKMEAPVQIGDIIVKDILNTGVNFVATRNLKQAEAKGR